MTEQISFRFGDGAELLHPCDAVVPVDGFRHERFQRTCLTVKIDDTFLYIGTLFTNFIVNLALGNLGVECEQAVYEVLDAVKTLFGGGEVQQLVHGQHPCAVDYRLVRMVNQHVAIRLVLLAEKYEVDTELGFQFLLQLFLVRAHVPVLFEDVP